MADTAIAPPPPSTPAPPAAPTTPPAPLKPGESRMNQSLGKLRDTLKGTTTEDGQPIQGLDQPKTPEAKEPPPNRPGAIEPKTDAKEPSKPEAKEPVVEGKPPTTPDVPIDPKTGKPPGAWQLKERAEKLSKAWELRALDAETKLAKLGDHENLSKRAQEAEARAKEYEDRIRKIDYTSHPEFQAKFEKPYQEAVDRTVKEMAQFAITQEDGNVRAATFNDLVNLARVPDGKIDEVAEQWFGKSGQRVIAKIDKLRQLEEAKQQAIESSQKEFAASREQETTATKTAREEAFKFWQESISEDDTKREFLKPKEEDDEWNAQLEKSRESFEEAWKSNPSDPKLTSEQRREVIRKKASLRGKAIGFSMRGIELKRANATIASLQAELAQIKQTQPGAGNGRAGEQGFSAITDPMERSKALLRQRLQQG